MTSTFKKALSVLLAAVLAAGCVFALPFVSADDTNLKFAVGSDLHIVIPSEELDINYPENELYFHASGSGNLYDEASAITSDFLYSAAENNVDFILIPGDMTRSGTEEQHKYVANIFKEFEDSTGIDIYVVPGNHDYFDSTPAQFKEYYSSFGYDEAIATDTDTASYVCDLNSKYRLIAVDSDDPGENGDGFTDALFSWIEEATAKAKADNKEIILMMHHPLLEHLALGHILMGDFIVRDYKDVAEKFSGMGIKCVFTGHEHGNDIAKYECKNGDVIHDVLTTSLSSYPLEYRLIDYSVDGLKSTMVSIDDCNMDALIPGYNDAQLELMETDYNEYAYGYFKYSVEKKIAKYVEPAFIRKKLKVTEGALYDEIGILMSNVEDVLEMPLYLKDAENISIESLSRNMYFKLPESNYYNLYDLVASVVAAHYYGDENFPCSDSPEGEILVRSLNSGLKYILRDTGDETVTAIINLIASELGLGELDKIKVSDYIGGIINGASYDYNTAKAVLFPLLDKFAVDEAPGDRDVEISFITEKKTAGEKILSFFDKVKNFFLWIIDILKAVIGNIL